MVSAHCRTCCTSDHTKQRLTPLPPSALGAGPFDASKLPTVVQRSSQSLKKSLAYMRASDEKRLSQPQLAASASRLPMLSQNACLAEMRALGVKMWFAEGEADSPTAELAQRRGEGALVGSNGERAARVEARRWLR